jgi:hypothetical protein
MLFIAYSAYWAGLSLAEGMSEAAVPVLSGFLPCDWKSHPFKAALEGTVCMNLQLDTGFRFAF